MPGKTRLNNGFKHASHRKRWSADLKGFAPNGPLVFWWNGGYEAKWLRKSGSLAWLGAWETLGKTNKLSKTKF